MPNLITLISIVTCLLAGLLANAADSTAAFVSGFDRFARHNTITPEAGGRLLLSELSCTACHTPNDPALLPKRGPVLDGVADRLNAAWIHEFLTDPNHVKPGTTMPNLLADLPTSQKNDAAEALTAFLMSLHKPFPEIKATGANPVPMEFWDRGDSDRGKEIYHQVGCVACHEPDGTYEISAIAPSPIDQLLTQLEPGEIVEMGLESAARKVESIPHPNVADKYTTKGLTHFLLQPESSRPAGRMPNFSLSAVDAAHVAAYMITHTPANLAAAESEQAKAELAGLGQKLFSEIGCVNCHQVPDMPLLPAAKMLAELRPDAESNCLNASAPGLPHYELDQLQRQAILSAINASQTESTADALQSHLLKFNCYACHDRDKAGGVGRYRRPYFETVRNVDIGDEGRLPPSLSGVGHKLTEATLKTIFAGKGRIRSHMHIRMPHYPVALTKNLPEAFAKADRKSSPAPDSEVFGDTAGLVNAGRALMDVGCVQCHSFNEEALPGTIGVDLAGITSRVHPKWFQEFLRNPGEMKQRTRMPTFFPNGKSQATAILNGDMDRQISAMWEYLKQLPKQPLPEKIVQARNRSYELIPQDRPIILRTFMQQAGPHAIAVGFPQKVHFAFDSENIRLAEAWRGRFIDAQGTWFERFTPVAEPLGQRRITFPQGPPFAFLTDAKESWPIDSESASYHFRGYRIQTDGVPVLLYRIGDVNIEDRIQPGEPGSLKRTFKLLQTRFRDKDAIPLRFKAHSGKQLQLKSQMSYTDETGLRVTISRGLEPPSELRRSADRDEWLIPLTDNSTQEFEVQYAW